MMMAPLQLGTDRTDPLESSRHFDNIHRLLFQLVPVYSNQMSLSFFFSFLRLNVIIMAIVCFFNGKTEEFWPFFAIFHLNRPKFNSFRLFLTLKPKFWLVFDLESENCWPANPKNQSFYLKKPKYWHKIALKVTIKHWLNIIVRFRISYWFRRPGHGTIDSPSIRESDRV